MSDDLLKEAFAEVYKKGHLTVTSNHCSGYPLPGLHTSHLPTSIAKPFVESLGPISSSMREHVYKNSPIWTVDPDSLKGPDDLTFIDIVGGMINIGVKMPYDPKVRKHFVASLNAAQIAYLNQYLKGDVLNLGVDSQGADLLRIDKAAALTHRNPTVYIVDGKYPNGHKLDGTFNHINRIEVYSTIEDFLDGVSAANLSKIAHVIMNHTFTSFCSSESVMEKLLVTLKDNQHISVFGTYMDPASIVMEKAAGVIADEAMIEYLGIRETDGKCYHKIRVLDTIYYDSIFSTDKLYSLFKKSGWKLDIYHASRFLNKVGGIKKFVRKNLSTVQCLRVAKASPAIPFPPTLNLGDTFNLGRTVDLSGDLIWESVPETSLPAFPVKKNKGMPLNGRDIACLGDSYWWGIKHDGVHCQMWLEGDRLQVSCGLGAFVVYLHGQVHGKAYMEGEIMFCRDVKVDLFSNMGDFKSSISHILVFDGLCSYHTVEDPFISRWRDIEGFVYMNADHIPFIQLQQWNEPHDVLHPTVNNYLRGSGIVIQPKFSPPGKFRNGFGSARYIKGTWTYEIRDVTRGRIIEVEYGSKKYVRDRPDRTLPSTLEDVNRIENSVTYPELCLFVLVLEKYYRGDSSGPAVNLKPEKKPYFIANTEEYMSALLKERVVGSHMTPLQADAFKELSCTLVSHNVDCESAKKLLERFSTFDHEMKMMKDDVAMLERAKRVLKASENPGTIVDCSGFLEGQQSTLQDLYDVEFKYVSDWVLTSHFREGEDYHWTALVHHRLDDNVMSLVAIGDDVEQSSIYLFREVPMTMNTATVHGGKVRGHGILKRNKETRTNVEAFKGKKYIMPSIVVKGHEMSCVEGNTYAERLQCMKKLVAMHKGVAREVIIRFVIPYETFMKCPNPFTGLEQAVEAASLQYVGIMAIGL